MILAIALFLIAFFVNFLSYSQGLKRGRQMERESWEWKEDKVYRTIRTAYDLGYRRGREDRAYEN